MREEVRKILGLPVKEPIEYWAKYWNHFADILCDKDNYDTALDSPRFLIDNIISEIEYNDFKNKDNKELFRIQLSRWNKEEAVFNKLFNNKVTLLLKRWDETEFTRYLLSVCRKISVDINKGTYFDGLLEHLTKIIKSTQTLEYSNKKDIQRYTQLVIAEFIASGFVIEDIKSIPHDIQNILRIGTGEVICAPDTYKGLNRTNYDSDNLYYKAIENVIRNRTITERVSVLRDYYYIEPKECYVLIRLTGIKGDIDCKIDNINIYAPHKKKYITETPTLSRIEQIIPERNYINAAIPVKHKMLYSSVAFAIQKLDQIIDLLALTFNTSKPIGYSQRDISVIENGSYKCGINCSIGDKDTEQNHKEFTEYMSLLDISEKGKELTTLKERISAINKHQTQDTSKLATAAHWFQKGKHAHSPEDKLLFHWIAIESLLKTDISVRSCITDNKNANLVQMVQKIASAILVRNHFCNYSIDAYIYINHLTTYNDNYLDIPTNTIKKASLDMKAGDKVYVGNFLNNIPEIVAEINDEIYKTELEDIHFFYNSKEGVIKKERDIKNDILLIYRLRNLIAHNAVYPKYLINFYANKTQEISCALVRYLIEKYRTSSLSIDDTLINIASSYDEFLQNIENELLKLKSRVK